MNANQEHVPEGEEPPPRGVKVMAWVRWGLLAALGLLAVYSVMKLGPASTETHAASSHGGETWVCPMHPQVVKDGPSSCPICGMDLVKVEVKAKTPSEKWVCPMHAQVVKDGPSSCPICGMDLVKVDVPKAGKHEALGELTRVEVPPDRIQKLGIRTVKAVEKTLSDTVHTVGVLAPSESRTAEVHTRFNGWVEETLVRETGAVVHKGDALVRIYSPEVLQAFQDFKAAQSANKDDPLSQQILKAASQRMQLLGLDSTDVTTVDGARPTITLRAPRDGFITAKNVVDGTYVQPGAALFEVSDLSVVWLMVDIREDALARVSVGQKAVATFPALPGMRVEGRVSYLYPALDTVTRTLKARIELQNPKGVLRPGLAANVDVTGAPWKGVVVPADAVVQTGHATYVFVQTGEGIFEPRLVKTGQQTPQEMEVRTGVASGDDVVVGALFLLDSESRLRAALQDQEGADDSQHH